MFKKIVKDDNLTINYDTPDEPEQLAAYIEGWQQKIWDHGFQPYLKGTNYFKKGMTFVTYPGSMAVVRRVLYR